LPQAHEPRAQAYINYLGGLTFISLNCIQWRCEAQAFCQFLASFKLLVVESSYALPDETVESAIRRFLGEKYPNLDDPEAFVELARKCGQPAGPVPVKIGDLFLMKLLCETIFRDRIVPEMLRAKRQEHEDKTC
jgi:hypothetical protein